MPQLYAQLSAFPNKMKKTHMVEWNYFSVKGLDAYGVQTSEGRWGCNAIDEKGHEFDLEYK